MDLAKKIKIVALFPLLGVNTHEGKVDGAGPGFEYLC